MSHQAGLLTTLHHIHICFPQQGGNMVTTMGWGFSDFRHLFCFTLLINKACMCHIHIPLMYIFNSPANECWVSFSFNALQRHRRGDVWFLEVISQISRSHGPKKSTILTQIECFQTVMPVWIHRWLRNNAHLQTVKKYLKKKCPIVFQCHPSVF